VTRWVAAAGAFVVSLDSMLNIAFPAIAAAFAVPPERMRWLIVAYVLTYALTAFAGGAVADRVGHGVVFTGGLALTALALGLAAAAPALGWLLAARVLQGVAGGLVYGTAPGLVTLAAAPAARTAGLAFVNAAIGIALTLGPLAAGLLVEALGWRAVFHARVPLALAALAWAWRALPRGAAAPGHRLVRAADVLHARVLVPGALAFAANGGIFAIWLLAPFYLVTARGLDAPVAGLLFALTPLGTALGAPVAGWLTERLGPRLPIVGGLVVEALGLTVLGHARPDTPLPVVAAGLLAAGLGLGVTQVPVMASVMAAFSSAQQGAAGGFTFLARTLGVVTGVLVLAQLYALRRAAVGADAAVAEAFAAAAVAVALAATLGLVRLRQA
jgi:MFS family permease